MQQQVEIEIIVRVRDSNGKILGVGAQIKAATGYMDTAGLGPTVMVLRQRRMIAEGIKDMAMDFVRAHFRDTRGVKS